MSITNTAKPSSPSYTNTAKPSFAETWATITTTWATETQTWTDLASVINNTTLGEDYLWSSRFFPWTDDAPWQTTAVGMTNIAKP